MPGAASSVSTRKKGLPPVLAWSDTGSMCRSPTSVRTASTDSGNRWSRVTLGPTREPMARRRAWSSVRSSRWVARMRQGSVSSRRATKRTRSRVASSAHCRSSSTTTVGWGGDASSARKASNTALWSPAAERVGERSAPAAGDVREGAEGSRREQVVAPPDDHLSAADVTVEQLLHQGRLAGARFPADEDEVAVLIDLVEPVDDRLHLLVPLEEVHVDAGYDGPGGCARVPGCSWRTPAVQPFAVGGQAGVVPAQQGGVWAT